MTLREQFEKEVAEKYKGNSVDIIFYQKTEDYIIWLENKVTNKGEICLKYTDKCIKASLQKASENVTAYIQYEGEEEQTSLVSQKSIINLDNIVLL